jgi:hypothetical protein
MVRPYSRLPVLRLLQHFNRTGLLQKLQRKDRKFGLARLSGPYGYSAAIDCPADNLKIGPAQNKMAAHREKTGRVKATEAVENIDANAANATLILAKPIPFPAP